MKNKQYPWAVDQFWKNEYNPCIWGKWKETLMLSVFSNSCTRPLFTYLVNGVSKSRNE